MKNFIKQLLCKHVNTQWLRNIYGDEIIEYNWKRSIHICVACDKLVLSDKLHYA